MYVCAENAEINTDTVIQIFSTKDVDFEIYIDFLDKIHLSLRKVKKKYET